MPVLVEGTVIYGAILLVLAGIFDVFEGLAAIFGAIDGFLFIPYQPFWSVLLIALDVAVIWALCRYEPAEPRDG